MATGMITRQFDHPSGATATLEMPAGWSRNCYYVMTLQRTNGEHGVAPERVTCNTPEDARQRAIERERAALANGWRPRTAATKAATTGNDCAIHLSTGQRLPLGVRNIEERVEADDPMYDIYERRVKRTSLYINATLLNGSATLELAARILIRQRWGTAEQLRAAVVTELTVSENCGEATSMSISAVCDTFEGDEQIAIARWHDREQVILDLLDDPDPSIHHLYQEISKRVQEPADRPQVQQEILRRRAELQADEIREREAAVSRERAAAEAAVARTLPTRPRQQTIPPIQQDVKAAMRRLAGGQDLGAPKRRKIDLGE